MTEVDFSCSSKLDGWWFDDSCIADDIYVKSKLKSWLRHCCVSDERQTNTSSRQYYGRFTNNLTLSL